MCRCWHGTTDPLREPAGDRSRRPLVDDVLAEIVGDDRREVVLGDHSYSGW
jgi:hypothetical protein